MKTQKKNLKPISLDAHFKYRCANDGCSIEHWLSIKETQTKNFKVVCDCGTVFSPKKISKLKIVYSKSKKKTPPESAQETLVRPETEKNKIDIPFDIVEKAAKILVNYGFTEKESKELLIESYKKQHIDDIGTLIKFTLENFGGKNG